MSPTVPTAECQNYPNSNNYQETFNQKQNKNNMGMSKIRINTKQQQSQENVNVTTKSVSTPTGVQTPDYAMTMAMTDVQGYVSGPGHVSPGPYFHHAPMQQQPWGMQSYPTMPMQTAYTSDMHLPPSPNDPTYLSVSGVNSPTPPPMYHHQGQSLSMTPPAAPHVFGSYRPKTPVSHQGKDTPVSTRNDTPNSNSPTSDPKKKSNRKSNDNSRFPVVKIPEALKKMGQPHPAFYLNSHGFPLRSGKPDCKHYISKGWCAYGTLCKFNHPDSAAAQSFAIVPASPMPTSPGYIQAHWPGMVPAASGYHWGPWAPTAAAGAPPQAAQTAGVHGVTSPMTPTAYHPVAAASSPAAGCYPCVYQAPNPHHPHMPQTSVAHQILSDESLNSTMSHQLCDESDQVTETESLEYEN